MSSNKGQKYFIFTVGIILLVTIIGINSFTQKKGGSVMILKSNAFENNEFIPNKYSCKGDDINPELSWQDVPEGTKSFALSVKDPDAPIGTFVHWLVYDIDSDLRKIEENSVPGKQVENNFGKEAYGGPCPPSGVHRYYFRLFALDTESLGQINSMEEFDKKVEEHTIEKAELMGKFEK
jgi:Raf kinase inhibitor-like YbhB/YbcL family protein